MLHTKFQLNIPSGSGEKNNLISYGGHLGFSTRLNFTILKSCKLVKLLVKFEIHGGSGF